MKLHEWLVRNDEKRYYYLVRAKSAATLRKRVDSKKETVIGREDKLPASYRPLVARCRVSKWTGVQL